MSDLWTPVALIAGCVLAQTLIPDRAIWHQGWYSVALFALAVYAVVRARKSLAPMVVAAGACLVAFAGIASGLMAPDPQLVIGTPGTPVAVAGLGTLVFPALRAQGPPSLERSGRIVPIDGQRYVAAFVLRDVPRTVIGVDAYDRNGAHLTVTQPEGTVFSSPVLLMEQTQRISGLTLPFDSFSVPAAHRIVKAVLFSPAQVALMRGIGGPPQAVVLFAVDDETDRPLPHAIGLAHSGETISLGGLRLRAVIATYPAMDVLSIPYLPALVAGFAMIALGIGLGLRTPSRS